MRQHCTVLVLVGNHRLLVGILAESDISHTELPIHSLFVWDTDQGCSASCSSHATEAARVRATTAPWWSFGHCWPLSHVIGVLLHIVSGCVSWWETTSHLLGLSNRLSCWGSCLVLLHSKDKFLHNVLMELIIFCASSFRLLDPRIDREESGLIELLRFHECGDPVFLSLLDILNYVLLIHQVLFIFTEVLGADILDLVKLLIVLAL